MKLATARLADASGASVASGVRTAAVRVEGGALVELGFPDVGALLATAGWQTTAAADGPRHDAAGVSYAPVVPHPSKVVCVGLNYKNHIQEMGRDLPEYPTLFCKFADCLVGATDDVVRPPETAEFDWEVELAVVIGTTVRRADEDQAAAAIAGFTILNDVTCRDWQFRTREWLQGKNWDSTTPVGPWLVTPDEVGGARPALAVTCSVDGAVMQSDTTGDLLFDPVELVRYVSTMVRLNPGDIIATGTPGGVGHARRPPVYLTGGELLVTEIEGLGPVREPRRGRGPLTARDLATTLRFVAAGTRLCAHAIDGLDERTFGMPTALPGWTRKHLVAHLAGNAEALLRLLHWAGTGERTPMYTSPEQRNADIEAGARRSAAALTQWFTASSAELEAALTTLPEDAWTTEVVTAQGRTVPASEVPWMRSREVLVHAVDLGTGVSFADLPEAFLETLQAEIRAKRTAAGEQIPGLAGSLADVTAYLAGRGVSGVTTGDGVPVSAPSPWL